ncbi:MAG: peptidoglycan DD-metalloendopeptidase family protein [bacterium]
MNLLICLALTCNTLTLRQIDARIAEHQAELARTRRDLEDLRQRLTGLSRAESTSLGRIEDLREQMAATRRYITQLSNLIGARTTEVAALSREVEIAATRLELRKAELALRLTSIYKHGRLLPLQLLLDAGSPARLHRRLFYLRWLARADRRLALDLAAQRAELAGRRARLVEARTDLERLREEQLGEERRLLVARETETGLLNRLRSEQTAQRRISEELASSVSRLEQVIQSLEQQRGTLKSASDDHYFTVNKGRLPWPLRGEVIARFGAKVHPRYKTTTANNGIDIAARAGTPAAAVHAGKVAYADQFLGYGRLVILDHEGGFYTLYGNLEEIAVTVGEQLTGGLTVGKTRDYLHFEIRRAGEPVDPLQWLER